MLRLRGVQASAWQNSVGSAILRSRVRTGDILPARLLFPLARIWEGRGFDAWILIPVPGRYSHDLVVPGATEVPLWHRYSFELQHHIAV